MTTRPPVGVAARRQNIDRLLAALARSDAQMQTALAAFAPDFDFRLKPLTRPERDSLDLTLATRNESQHAYEHLQAIQVHAAVVAQRRTAPGLIARLGRWVATFPLTS